MLPVLLSEGHVKRGIPLPRIAALTATNAANAFGIGASKGSIAVGKDADFAIVDPDAEWVLDTSHLKSSAGYSIYEGTRFTGKVLHTILRGAFIQRDGALIDSAIGQGRYLYRDPVSNGG